MIISRLLLVFFSLFLNSSIFAFNSLVLEKKINEFNNENSWALKSINNELSCFNSENISVDKIVTRFNQSNESEFILMVEIKNGLINFKHKGCNSVGIRMDAIKNSIRKIAKYWFLPDVVFIVSLHDGLNSDEPIFTFSKNKRFKCILMPDFEALFGYHHLNKEIFEGSKKHPWSKKISKIFWRGSLTGGFFNLDNYMLYPRSKAVIYSIQNSDILDARFIKNGQADELTLKKMINEGFIGNSISVKDSLIYKYLLDIDGNACCYSRTYWALLSNSVLLKMHSENVQWFYDLLVDGLNYIKIDSELNNLRSIFNDLNSHNEFSRKIAINASELVRNELCHEATLAYFYKLICKFAELQNK